MKGKMEAHTKGKEAMGGPKGKGAKHGMEMHTPGKKGISVPAKSKDSAKPMGRVKK